MRCLSDDLTTTYVPEALIVAYKSRGSGKRNYFLESRKIDNKGCVGEGKPVSKKFITSIVKTFSATFEETPHGAMPSNMLFVDDRPGHKHYIWYNKPQKRMMTFAKSIGIDDGMYAAPGIIYDVNGDSLSVYAFKGSSPKNKLYKYPSFNLYSNNRVCLGNAQVSMSRNLTWSSLMKRWEMMYWNSTNSHLIGGSPIKGNLVLALKDSTEGFDTSLLLPVNVTLDDLMK